RLPSGFILNVDIGGEFLIEPCGSSPKSVLIDPMASTSENFSDRLMSDSIIQIRWPLGEAVSTECQFGDPILAPERFLKNWGGFDSAVCRDLILERDDNWCRQIAVGEASGWLFGDVPGCFFPGIARELRESDGDAP